jgi:hypothetical protein
MATNQKVPLAELLDGPFLGQNLDRFRPKDVTDRKESRSDG